MIRRRRILRAAAAAVVVAALAMLVSGCGLFGPSAPSAKASAQQARKAMDDIVYYDVELLLVPTVVMHTTDGTAVVTSKQAAEMKEWLGRDLAVIERSAKELDRLSIAPSLGEPKTDELLASTSHWLNDVYLPAIREAVATVAVGRTLRSVEASLGVPWSQRAGEQAKSRVAALRAALAKKAGP
jgi:hypothetical protein